MGEAVPLGEAVPPGDAVPLAVGLGEADGCGVGAPAPASQTGRNRSSAVCWTVLRMDLSCLPGIEMTMLSPAVVTSDSATPKLSTRLRMIDTAWFSESFGGEPPPLTSRGVRMTLVPPSRSRPSRGVSLSAIVSVCFPMVSGATTRIRP